MTDDISKAACHDCFGGGKTCLAGRNAHRTNWHDCETCAGTGHIERAAPSPSRAACQHADTRAGWDSVTCNVCGAFKADSGWGIAKGEWFKSRDEAEFYKKNGRRLESATTPAEVEGRWITQTAFYDPDKPDACTGNCTESAIASIFGLALDAVPSFAGKGGGDFWFAVDCFIESMDYEMHMMAGNYQPQGMYLASGPSDRGCSHMVVMQGGTLLHDPHPSRAGIQKVEHVWMLAPKDPAIHATLARQLAEAKADTATATRCHAITRHHLEQAESQLAEATRRLGEVEVALTTIRDSTFRNAMQLRSIADRALTKEPTK